MTVPDSLRAQLRGQTLIRLLSTASGWRMATASDPTAAGKLALRSVARRYRDLSREIQALDRKTTRLVAVAAPSLLALPQVGPETASVLLIAAGDNPQRLRSEGAFANLCGAAPLQASS